MLGKLGIGDIVARKSYGGDIYFRITNVLNNEKGEPVYILKGLLHRLQADSKEEDLIPYERNVVAKHVNAQLFSAKRYASNSRSLYRFPFFGRRYGTPGKIVHIDADKEFLNICLKHYANSKIRAVGKLIKESDQPSYVRQLVRQYCPDILVVTGHDGIRKNSGSLYSLDNYINSKYYVQSAKEARNLEPDFDRLCIFAGACQSYYEAIMKGGANFASSPARVLINALDPAFVSEKIALTDKRIIVTSSEISRITKCGKEGIDGIDTRGHKT